MRIEVTELEIAVGVAICRRRRQHPPPWSLFPSDFLWSVESVPLSGVAAVY